MVDTVEDITRWQKRLAAQANNRAWRLSEMSNRSQQEDDEMLEAAFASSYFWNLVGTPNNKAHASQLVAHVSALLHLPIQAKEYFAKCESFFLEQACESWERACAFAVKASVAAAAGDSEIHASSYRKAEQLIAALADREDRDILNATLLVVPKPRAA